MIIVLGCGYCFGIVFSDLLDVFREGKSSTGEYYYRLVTESQVVVWVTLCRCVIVQLIRNM